MIASARHIKYLTIKRKSVNAVISANFFVNLPLERVAELERDVRYFSLSLNPLKLDFICITLRKSKNLSTQQMIPSLQPH